MISIVFVSNYFNHHEKYLCEELSMHSEVDFKFIQTERMSDERLALGWGVDVSSFPYVICSYSGDNNYQRAIKICEDADVLILGSAPYDFVSYRIKNNKLTFYYAERLFRNGIWHLLNPKTLYEVVKRFVIPGRKSNFYLLAASAYTAIDTARIGAFNNRRFKWGHFIDVGASDKRKSESVLQLLWCGRFIRLKHPDYPIRIAKTLSDRSIPFHLDIIGNGPEESKLCELRNKYGLTDKVSILGSMLPAEVRRHMDSADIYMFTSDFNEGWGAVLGEAMSSGCAVVSSHGIGATPFLVKNGENGLIYKTCSFQSFEREVLKAAYSEDLRTRLSQKAIATMINEWNPHIAAQRFVELCKSIMATGRPIYYKSGPLSKAEILKNNWFKDDSI